MNEEWEILCKEIKEEEAKLKRSSADSRTPEEVSKQYDDLQNKSAGLNRTIDALRRESQEKRNRISQHEAEAYRCKDEIVKMQGMTDAIASLNKTIEELNAAIQKCDTDIQVWFHFGEANLLHYIGKRGQG